MINSVSKSSVALRPSVCVAMSLIATKLRGNKKYWQFRSLRYL